MEKKSGTSAFSLAVAGNGLAALLLPSNGQGTLIFTWGCYAFMLCLCMHHAEEKDKGLCMVFLLSAFLFGTALILRVPAGFRLECLLFALCVLAIVWPLRFLALGEAGAALTFGTFFWMTTFRLAGMAEGAPWPICLFSTLLLFSVAFIEGMARYRPHKAVQRFSLPVLMGNLFPALDKRWTARPVPRRIALVPALVDLAVTVAAVMVL